MAEIWKPAWCMTCFIALYIYRYRYFQLTASLNFRTCNHALWILKVSKCLKVGENNSCHETPQSTPECLHKISILCESVNALIALAAKNCRSITVHSIRLTDWHSLSVLDLSADGNSYWISGWTELVWTLSTFSNSQFLVCLPMGKWNNKST